MQPSAIKVIDSHSAGEPTRIVISGGPDLGKGSMAERMERFRSDHDSFRSMLIAEPRGHDVLVGGLLCEPCDPQNSAGVIFFNNVGYLGMCGHGTIGLMATLAYLGRIESGSYTIETPVGNVEATLRDANRVSVRNVSSYRYKKHVPLVLPGIGTIHGDIAWGGNWFFLVSDHGQDLSTRNSDALLTYTSCIRRELERQGITGKDDGLIDHIELFGPAVNDAADSKNFVLCPGLAWDRSPCGTGTSAKLACLAADGKLAEGDLWRQAGLLDTVFEATYIHDSDHPGAIIPTITGTAYVTAETELIIQDDDPFAQGIAL